MSSVYYKFASSKNESRVTFDGTHISVFDIKKEIMLNNKMGSGKDFDLGLYDAATGEELKDDHYQVPRSKSLIARRLPPANKAKGGSAAKYIAGTSAALGGRDDLLDRRVEAGSRAELLAKKGLSMPGMPGGKHMTARFDGKSDPSGSSNAADALPTVSTGSMEEDARLAAMMQQQDAQWLEEQNQLSQQTRVAYDGGGRGRGTFRGGAAGRGGASGRGGLSTANYNYLLDPEKPPPPGYICYRCGQKGHWIQACPTNENPEWENKPRFKRTTGIPRSFLKTVEQPAAGEGGNAGVMITADGSFVTIQSDTEAWKKHTKAKALTEADVREGAGTDSALSCPICSRLLREAVRTPCCKTLYCEECIHTTLLEQDFVCPSCESKIVSLDRLKPDDEARQKVEDFVKLEIERSKESNANSDDAGNSDADNSVDKRAKEEENASEGVKQEQSPKPVPTSSEKPSPAVKEGTPEPGEITGEDNQVNANMVMSNNNFDMNAMNMMGMMMGMNPMMQFQALQMQATQTMMALQNPQLPPPMRMQLMMQLQMQQNAMQMIMSGNPMAMMGGHNNMGSTGHSGANTPNHHIQQHQEQQQRRPAGRSPQKVGGNGLPMQQGQSGPSKQPTVKLGQGNGSPNRNQHGDSTSSKRKLDDVSDGGVVVGATDDSEIKAPKQIKTQ
ncbi:hypothetical protein QFC22_000394 [Naganishia vaughanmartiniae]|uniref:Uncharacterized protein n=1 Tax=Naganishia vaughanmartiniae TaxID=1424756 RepID=A0ACC2XP69_9TREE|nr:hypothetical protein QFC22_000394 [Naganishia vaughanmartiniae]